MFSQCVKTRTRVSSLSGHNICLLTESPWLCQGHICLHESLHIDKDTWFICYFLCSYCKSCTVYTVYCNTVQELYFVRQISIFSLDICWWLMQPENNLAQCSSVAYLDDNYRPLCSHDTALTISQSSRSQNNSTFVVYRISLYKSLNYSHALVYCWSLET